MATRFRVTISEAAIMVVIVGVLIALMSAQPQWVSDGDITLPVKFFVFDAVQHRPIPNASCVVSRSPPLLDASLNVDRYPEFISIAELPENFRGITDAMGFCDFDFKFWTSASNVHPQKTANLNSVWVQVEASGFGGIVVPVRYERRATSELRKQGHILMTIGLVPINGKLVNAP